jgi:CRISPR-associated protein Cas5d
MEFYNKQFCIEVWGDYACYTRPEMKVERVSYDVITPSAARGVFEAIFWKPAIQWKVKKIEVLNPIRWISVRRNEVGKLMSDRSNEIFIDEPGSRQQRAGLFLRDVAYRLYAEMEFINPKNRKIIETHDALKDLEEDAILRSTENPGKYNAIFERRAKKGQCFNQPYLGCREFSCNFRFIEHPEKEEKEPIKESTELGFMLYDMDFSNPENPQAMFYRPQMKDGVIVVPLIDSEEVRR